MNGILFLLAWLAGCFMLLVLFGVVVIYGYNYLVIGINKLRGKETRMMSQEQIADMNRRTRDRLLNRRR